MKRPLLGVAIVAACLVAVTLPGCAAAVPSPVTVVDTQASSVDSCDAILAKAFADRTSDLEVEGSGTVNRLLTDDTEGSRHQRFIVQLASGQTLLITHNVDVAPRVSPLQEGDTVAFKGEYVWNSEGGLVHWTHHDPAGDHVAGWVEHDGERFE